MTVPDLTAPRPAGEQDEAREPTAKQARSLRELTPFVVLAMILIPSLIVLCLAIADPGAKSSGPDAGPAVAVAPGP